jgi:hypothetical protein
MLVAVMVAPGAAWPRRFASAVCAQTTVGPQAAAAARVEATNDATRVLWRRDDFFIIPPDL